MTAFPIRWLGRRGYWKDVRAVSPVIGTVLILMIVILAMAGIMMWGVPAIQGLQDHAEFESVLSQAIQLNGDLRTLRDPQNTRLVTLSIQQGILFVTNGSRWVVTAHTASAYAPMNVTGWEADAATSLGLTSVPGTITNITLSRADGGTFTNVAYGSSPWTSLSLGTYKLKGNVTRIQFKENAQLMAEAWIFEAGRISYYQKNSSPLNRVHLEMGAVFAQQDKLLYIQDQPSVKEPVWDVDPKDTAFFLRAFQVTGNSSISGQTRVSVLANLVDNYGTTRGRPYLNATVSARIQIDDGGAATTKGLLEEAFCNHFKLLGNYTQVGTTDCAGGDVNLLYNPDNNAYANGGNFSYELSQAVVKISVRKE